MTTSPKQRHFLRLPATLAALLSVPFAAFAQDETLPLEAAGSDGILADLKLPDGYQATVFAQPPEVVYPTFVKPTPDGAVFVAVDRNSSLDKERGRGSVLLCYDDDGDGRADRFTTFVEDVDGPRGLEWDGEWLYVVHSPHLTAFRDNDGDGVADESRVLVEGIAFDLTERPADHTSNGVTLGIDGFLYLAIGDFGFMEAKGSDGKTLQLRGGGVVRVRKDGSDLELFSRGTRNIYEVAVSPLLNIFARDNTNDGGGWNVRLHQFTGLEEHGYPSLYTNFSDEIVQPLADYGGGSGTGAHYLYEPGFPERDNDRLYTTDWGRSGIFQHILEPDGGNLKEIEQRKMFEVDRVTDMDVDGSSNLYLSSWAGGRYSYSGENVGYLLRVSPENASPSSFPDLSSLSIPELVALFTRPSATLNLAAQQEILRRDPESLANAAGLASDSNQTLETRAVALYTLLQVEGKGAITKISSLTSDPELGSLAVRALGDPDLAADVDPQVFLDALQSTDARSRLEAAISISRTGKQELAPSLLPLANEDDAVVAHTAIKALVKLADHASYVDALDDPSLRNGAVRALKEMHNEATADALIQKLDTDIDSATRESILSVLARLTQKEAEWDGEGWGTRPDTTGPYYDRTDWAATPRIRSELDKALEDPSTNVSKLLADMARNQLVGVSFLPQLQALAAENPKLEAAYLEVLEQQDETPASAIPTLTRIANSDDRPGNLRLAAASALARTGDADSLSLAFSTLSKANASGEEGFEAYGHEQDAAERAILFQTVGAKERIPQLIESTQSSNSREVRYAWASLLSFYYDPIISERSKQMIAQLVDEAKADPQSLEPLISAIGSYKIWGAADEVTKAVEHSDPDVQRAARRAARSLRIDLSGERDAMPKVAEMSNEAVIEAVLADPGDHELGEALFNRQSCMTCHTVYPEQELIGPYLGNITSVFRRAELAEAVLEPNKTIAQGFITNIINTKDGGYAAGFVTSEAADTVTLRDMTGSIHTINTDNIKDRSEVQVSMMPPGLAAPLTTHEFASLLAYLEKLGEGQ